MKFSITRSELLSGLNLSQGIVERRTTIPILSNVLLEAAGDTLTVSATDQEIGVRRACRAKVDAPGSVTASARKLFEMVRELPDGEIAISGKENSWIEVKAGKGRFKLVGIDPREFPAMQRPTSEGSRFTVKVSSETLSEMLDYTSFAISSDETRASLNGVLIEGDGDGKLRMVATDGHRLAMMSRAIDGVSEGPSVILPRKAVAEIRKILEADDGGDLELIVGDGIAYLTRGPVEMSMRLISGEFPDYRQVIPSTPGKVSKIEVAPLLAALRRVSIVSSDRTRGIKLEVERGKADLSTINPDVGEGSEEIPAEYDGDPVNIGFNARYLIELLSVMPSDSTIEVGLSDDVSPGVFRLPDDADYCYIVMPMRL